MNTIENINNIVNEDTINAAMDAVEAVPVKAINWRKVGTVGGILLVLGAGTAAVIRFVKDKKAEKEAAANGIDNVKVAENDFVEKDSTEK